MIIWGGMGTKKAFKYGAAFNPEVNRWTRLRTKKKVPRRLMHSAVLADKYLIPANYSSYYSEKIIYMPHSYQITDSSIVSSPNSNSREEEGLPDNAFVFTCFNANKHLHLENL